MKSLKLSKRMEQAVELMKQEEFYLCELPNWSFWGAYNLPGQTIRTDTMKALEPPPDTWSVRMPAYAYTQACPVPELRRLPKGVMRYYETVLHRQRAPRV